jgi:outer membrane protein assembly factor BamB
MSVSLLTVTSPEDPYPSAPVRRDDGPVSAGVPIIDLDVAPQRPEGGRRGRPRIATVRGLPTLVVALLALAVLGPAAPPRPGMQLVLSAGGTTAEAFTLGAGALYTASYGPFNPASESGVRRYDLATGALQWAAPLPQNVQSLEIEERTGVLMARSGGDPRISFLDAANGSVLWRLERADTSVVTLTGRGPLVVTNLPGATELWLADARTGGTVWSRTLEAQVTFGPDDLWSGRPRWVVATGLAGTVVVLDIATGAELSRGDLGGPLRRADTLGGDSAAAGTVGADRLVVRRRLAGRDSLTAYSLVPFARLWSRDAGSDGAPVDCGPVWCLFRQDGDALTDDGTAGAGVEAIDPATGRLRWRAAGYAFAAGLDGLVVAGDTQEDPEISLLDPATGVLVRRLGRVIRVGDLLLHADTRAVGSAWVGRLEAAGGSWRVLGRVDSATPYGCEHRGRHLACPTTAGPTRVWRLP